MKLLFVAAGAFAGLVLALFEIEPEVAAILAGAVAGWVLARQRALGERLRALEARQPLATRVVAAPGRQHAGPAAAPAPGDGGAAPSGAPPQTGPSSAGAIGQPADVARSFDAHGGAGPAPDPHGKPFDPRAFASPSIDPHAASAPPPHVPGAGPAARPHDPRAASAAPPPAAGGGSPPPGGGGFDPFGPIRRWFTEGNVPARVGVLVLFAGVAALLRYASEAGWLQVPIALRLAGVGAAAILALAFGFRERRRRRTFGVSLQGGALGVLFLDVFAAFRLYDLLPAPLAFALLAVLTAAGCVLAVLQDARSLAALALIGGFLAPILVSTGEGNHVALFSWYALLNAALFGIARHKVWRALHLIGFASTFGIAAAWGVLRYDPAHLWSTEPFLAFFFAVYISLPLLHGARRASRGEAIVDGTLVFGTPLAAMGMQALLLRGELLPLAASALVVALVELVVARAIWRRQEMRVVAESYAALAIAFATLAVPLALSARATAAAFAMEGAALTWLGLRQDRRLSRFAGAALLALATLVLLPDGRRHGELPLANGAFASALLLALGALAAALAWWRLRAARWQAGAFLLLAALWWTIGGVAEIDRFVSFRLQPDGHVAFACLSAALFAHAHRRLALPLAAGVAAAALVLGAPLLLRQLLEHAQPFTAAGAAAWCAWATFGFLALRALREAGSVARAAGHLGWLFSWIFVFGASLHDVASRLDLGGGWRAAAIALPLLVVLALVLRAPAIAGAPLGDRFAAHRGAALLLLGAATALVFALGLPLAGGAAPLPWLPLLNPLDLARIASIALLAAALGANPSLAPLRPWALGAGIVCLATATTLRAFHHLGGEAWSAALVASPTAQTGLSVVWTGLGVAAWVAGSRRGDRRLWLAGALAMGVVLAKLAIVDRTHLGNLAGIVSFLAYGALCTLVGYLAPAPPRIPGEPPAPSVQP